jgi:cytochrome c-type biogenesis protein CcmH/NrfG
VASAPIRVALAVVALLAAAWLGLGVRAIDLESEGTVSSLRDARLLSADKTPLVKESVALFAADRRDEALATAKELVAAEPDNIEGWLTLSYVYAATDDSTRADRALQRAQALNPFVRPGGGRP